MIENQSSNSNPLVLNQLTDDIYGDLNGQGTCLLPQTIQPGDDYTCAFQGFVERNAGDAEIDTITATAQDDEDNVVSAQDSATVTIGDVLPSLPAEMTPGTTVECNVTGEVNGEGNNSVLNVVTAKGIDDEGSPLSDTADATVFILDRRVDLAVTTEILDTWTEDEVTYVTYLLDYINNGPDPAPNMSIANTLPADMVLMESSRTNKTEDMPQITWKLGTLLPNESGQITITAQVGQAIPG